jgi:hypothetical protein
MTILVDLLRHARKKRAVLLLWYPKHLTSPLHHQNRQRATILARVTDAD